MLSLTLAAIFFSGIHLGIAGTLMRDRAVAALGQNAFRALFSIASLAGIIWLVIAYKRPPYFATWGGCTVVETDRNYAHVSRLSLGDT